MPVNQQTDREWIEGIVRDIYRPPERAVVTRVYEHTDAGDPWNHEVDLLTKSTNERKYEVPVLTTSPGEVTLPHDIDTNYDLAAETVTTQEGTTGEEGLDDGAAGTAPTTEQQAPTKRDTTEKPVGQQDTDDRPECLVVYQDGDPDAPIVTGWAYSDEHRSPVGGVNDRRITVGDAVIDIRQGDDGKQAIHVGFQADDGGQITNGLVIPEDGTATLIDPYGNDLLAQTGPGGGVSPGGPGGGFPAIPTGSAGGSGKGVGDPQFTINQTLDAVADLGLDPKGNAVVNTKLQSVGSNTKVVFPPGTYKFDPTNDTGCVLDQNQIWLQGGGDKRDDVSFIVPAGKAGTGITCAGTTAISNLTFDHSNHNASVFALTAAGSGDKYFYNVRHVGKNLPSLSLGPPLTDEGGGKKHCWGISMPSGSTCQIENYKYVDPETTVKPYPNGLIGMQIPASHEGTLKLINNMMGWRSEHNVYGSRCPGGVHVEGGMYFNSCNTNLRIEGGNSYVQDAMILVDMHPSRAAQGSKSARGLWIENNRSTASPGFRVTNCDFIYKSQISSGNGCSIKAEYDTSGITIDNCRFLHDNDNYPCIDVSGIPGVTVQNSHFTGGTSKAAVVGNGDTNVTDCCNTISGGFVNCNTTNISTSNCDVPQR